MPVSDIPIQYNQGMDKKLNDFINRDDSYFIHYASEGFYNGSNPAPRISCIVIYNPKTDNGYRFYIKDHTDGNSLEQAERLILENFKLVFDKIPNVSFIHWGMNSDGFGFKAIQTRAKELGINLPIPDNDHLFDLSSYVAYITEKKLSIKQILWFNSLLTGNDFLDGKKEAEYFNKGKFEEIYYSVDLKVRGFADIVKLIQKNKLKTDLFYRHDDLKKEERRQQTLELLEAKEKLINEICEHNKLVLQMQKMGGYESEYADEYNLFFIDLNHPFVSLFASWFANK